MSFRSLLTAGLFFGGLVAGTAAVQAAPAMPQPGLAGADMVDTVAMHHHRHHRMHRHHSTRHERRMRRMNTMRHGNPNAKNPALRGYQQNLGNTTGGPRYCAGSTGLRTTARRPWRRGFCCVGGFIHRW